MKTKTFVRSAVAFAMALAFAFPCQAQTYNQIKLNHQRLQIDSRYDDDADSAAIAFLAPFKAKVDSMMAPVVGFCASDMTADRPESPMSNLLSDILVWASKDYNEKVDFAVYNIGGIRSSFSKGPVTIGNVLEVAPFENKISFLTLKGSDVINLFKQIGLAGGEGVSSSVRAVYTPDRELVSVAINGMAVDPKRKYRIVTVDYLVEGNDGLTAMARYENLHRCEKQDDNTRVIITNYFRKKAAAGESVDARVEGRLAVSEPDDGGKTIVILHTNDTHSQIFPFSKNISDKLKADMGGSLRRVTAVKKEREAACDSPLLLFDSGDFSQGSSYYTSFHGDVEIGLMNIMGYDAVTIGNHEFDFGLDNMARLFRMAEFPVVCSNLDFTGTPCEGLVKKYIVLERGGKKIGIFGLSPLLEGLVSAKNFGDTKYYDPVPVAKEMVEVLRDKEKCDYVICLSHLGYEEAPPATIDDERLVHQTTGIDLVLGGHSHTYMEKPAKVKNADGIPVDVNQNGKSGIFMSRFEVKLP